MCGAQTVYAGPCGSQNIPGIKVSVKNLSPVIISNGNSNTGLAHRFCVFENKLNDEVAIVDEQTLKSKKTSIAATYLLTGVNAEALKQIPTSQSEDAMCSALRGSAVSMSVDGNYPGPRGPKPVCFFGDGSSVGVSDLIRSTENPDYLGLRRSVRSTPAANNMPYQLVGSPVARQNVVTFINNGGPADASAWNFIWSGNSDITSGQPFDGVQVSPVLNGGVNIQITAGRQNSYGPSHWFDSQAVSKDLPSAACSNTSEPSELNFAITGSLSIQGISYPIVLGQGSCGGNNNWWIAGASPGWNLTNIFVDGSPTTILVTPDGKYAISYGNSGFSYSVSPVPN
jgi:hypothetical protein